MATLGTFKNKPPAAVKRADSKPEEGSIYLDSYGNWYKAPEITADKISKYLENVYCRGALDRLQRMAFNEKFSIEVTNENGEPDEELSITIDKMVSAPDVRLWHTMQRAWRDTAEWGPALLNPVWSYVGNEYRLIKLRRLPPESFSGTGLTSSYIKNKILPGILLNQDNDIEFWQKQTLGRITQLENVLMITDPLNGELGGSPLILPIIPLLSMLDFSWSARMQMCNKLGAGGLFFLKVTNPRGDDRQYAQRIMKNLSKNTAFQLRENMEVISVPISENNTAANTIDALSKLIIDHFSPASSIAKDGQILGGSSGPEWQMYQSYLRGIHAWLEEAFEQLLQTYLDVNQYTGYTVNITIPSPTIDRSEFLLKALGQAEQNKRVLPEEARQIYSSLGLDLPKLDEAGLAELAGQAENAASPDGMTPKLQKAKAVAEIVKACDLDPTHLISEEDAKAIVNQAFGIEEKKEFYQGGPGSGNWGHSGIPGWRGGSQAGSGGVHARPENYRSNDRDAKKQPPIPSNYRPASQGTMDILSTDEQDMVKRYTGGGGAESEEINALLIMEKGVTEIFDPDLKKNIKLLDTAIEKSQLNEGTVFRGVRYKELDIIDSLNDGDIYSCPSYKSTTMNEDWAKNEMFQDTRKVVLDIDMPNGTHAVSKGINDSEQEVIFGRNQQFKKSGEYTDSKGWRHIRMKVLL